MSHGFLLNRIDVSGNDFSIYKEFQFSCFVASNTAESDLALRNIAIPRTGRASYPTAR